MKRSGLWQSGRARDVKRQQREKQMEELRKQEAEYEAAKKRAQSRKTASPQKPLRAQVPQLAAAAAAAAPSLRLTKIDPPSSIDAKAPHASPASSVSFSQRSLSLLGGKPTSPESASKPLLSTARRRRPSSSSSDSSDGNDAHRRRLLARRREGTNPPPPTRPRADSSSSSEYSYVQRRRLARRSAVAAVARPPRTDGSSDESDESPARRSLAASVTRAAPEADDASLQSTHSRGDESDSKPAAVSSPVSVPRNPLARARAASTSGKKAEATAGHAPFTHQDELWAGSSSSSADETTRSPARKAAKRATENGKKETKHKTVLAKNDDDDMALETLKPDFAHPMFGPWEFEPLVLQVPVPTEQEETPPHLESIRARCRSKPFQVPASIARYLGKYQKEGILFMFRTVFQHSGGILGDDMGTGKTVQVLALLAALLEKTGTKADWVELERRRKIAYNVTRKLQMARDEALQQGQMYEESKSEATQQQLPGWAPILILAPSSILDNWITDAKTWGYFEIVLFQSADGYAGVDAIRSGAAEVLLCSHTVLQNANHLHTLSQIPWKLVVIDEHHKLKNPKARLPTNMRALRDNVTVPIIGLTGTVMQNNHKELHCLVDLAAKDLFGDWDSFSREFSEPIKLARAKDASKAMVELGAERSKSFSKIFAKVHLRRTKEEVLRAELPAKDERIVFCELSEIQKKIYQKLLSLPEFHLLRLAKTPCDCGINQPFFEYLKGIKTQEARLAFIRDKKDDIEPRSKCHYKVPRLDPMLDDNAIDPSDVAEIDPKAVIWRHSHDGDAACIRCPYCLIFPAMSRLMKVGTHAALIQPLKDPALMLETKERKDMERDLAVAKACIPKECLDQLPGKSYIRENSIMNDHFSLSGKMKVLDRLLRSIYHQGGRVLVFSASTKTLDLIENYVKSSGKRFLRMDGTTDRNRRKELADEFKADHGISIFLLSTRAMGLGLNLTSANFVIIFDVEWNPSNDAQAQDRAYRLGQTSDVVVFRLVSMGTIEELKYLRQVYKTQLKNETIVDTDKETREVTARLFRGVAGDKERRGELFGLANLLRFEDGTFMEYGEESRDSHRYGGDVFKVESLLTAAQTLDEQAEEELDLGVSDLVALTEGEMPTSAVSTKEMIGQDSQNIFDLYGHTGADSADDSDTTLGAGKTEGEDPTPVPTTSSGNLKIEASRLATILELPSPVRPPETVSSSYAAHPLPDQAESKHTLGESCPSPVRSASNGYVVKSDGPHPGSNTQPSSPLCPDVALPSNETLQMSRRDAPAPPHPYADADVEDTVDESSPSPVKSAPQAAAERREEPCLAAVPSAPSPSPHLSAGAQPATRENTMEHGCSTNLPAVEAQPTVQRVGPGRQLLTVKAKARTHASDRVTSPLTDRSSATAKPADGDIGAKKPFTLPPGAKVKSRKKKS